MFSKNRFQFFVTIIVITLFLLKSSHVVLSQSPTETPTSTPTSIPTPVPTSAPNSTPSPTPTTPPVDDAKLKDLQNKIKEYEGKISELQNEAKTLSSQIKIMDNNIYLTELRVEETKRKIENLKKDIEITRKKIDLYQKEIDVSTKALLRRIVATYTVGRGDSWQLFLTSDNISNYLTRLKYLQVVQIYDKRNIYAAEQSKVSYKNQQGILEEKQEEEEALKGKLEAYTQQLEQDKKDKENLLTSTKNNESVYQQKLKQALAEMAAIKQIVSGGGNEALVADVKSGDKVGSIIIGRSACSTGTHLHFEVQKDGFAQDPAVFLKNESVIFQNSPDGIFSFTGSWNWPINSPYKITQGFGMTSFARTGFYGGGPHSGIDMYSDSTDVKTVQDGKLYRGSISCGGGTLLYAKVEHSDGIKTYYLHIYPN